MAPHLMTIQNSNMSNQEEKIIDLRDKVTMYAPKPVKRMEFGKEVAVTHHAEGEETEVHPNQVEHFKKHGYTTEKPKGKAKE